MADSDEEHERGRSRDKFRRERYDYGGDKSKGRSDYREKRAWRDDSDSSRRRGRDDYDDEGGKRRYSSGSGYSRGDRDWSPPAKRMRREHWGFPDFPGMMAPYGMRPAPWPMHHDMSSAPHQQMPPAPGLSGDSPVMRGMSHSSSKHVMLTFKQFLAQEDDSIDVHDALSRYNEYKADFKRKQIEEFFEQHKEEDWFVSKYHPKQVKEIEETSAVNLKSRVQAFLSLLNSGQLDHTSLSHQNSDQIIRLMDAAVIYMEGGTEHDLLSLDQKQSSVDDEEEESKKKEKTGGDAKKSDSKDLLFMSTEPTEVDKHLAQQAKQYGMKMQQLKEDEGEERERKKKKKGDDYLSSDEGMEEGNKETKEGGMEADSASEKTEGQSAGDQEGTRQAANSSLNGDTCNAPRPLHLTQSVYIRHIPPKITAHEIVEVCRTIPGYLRIALLEPIPDKEYQRRGWVTYTNDSNIKDVTGRLSTTKFGDVQLTCMINRELTRRVKQSSQAACTKKGFHSDMQLVVKLVKFFDEKWKLWEHTQSEESSQQNPVLEFSQSLLTEGEESVAMVTGGGGEEEEGVINDPGTEAVDNISDKARAMDHLLWYLRIVHSLDYYNTMLFPSEDSMPHRCGIFTVRPNKAATVTIEEVSEYIEGMESKVKPLLEQKKLLSDSDMEKYGMKDAETEVERFIELNTQKLSENKYLCPLSGKKFKGPEFVKKHIFNKHVDKVDAVRQESEFFNNYLRDVDRPMPLEVTVNSTGLANTPKTPGADDFPSGPPGMGGRGGWNQRGQMMMFGRGGFNPGMGGFPPGMMDRGGFRPPRGGRRGRGRRVINYHDLDAPEEVY